ncbi:hypothetical protein CCR75_000784 [Bremia lactucae]|uniref:Uncharacterized protein n=1 Tax=Bremia lactucae TaxID=4779 RepID=A0A976IHU1_BRELC|nr:hypothetical protein CCR75_000784 [Bremia lactucae]
MDGGQAVTASRRCIAVFALENATSDAAFAKDALVASRMNIKPKGKQQKMRAADFGGKVQQMVFFTDYPDPGLRGYKADHN